MLDYDEKSVLRCFCHSDGSDDTFTGVEEIRGFFDGLFKMLSDLRSVVRHNKLKFKPNFRTTQPRVPQRPRCTCGRAH